MREGLEATEREVSTLVKCEDSITSESEERADSSSSSSLPTSSPDVGGGEGGRLCRALLRRMRAEAFMVEWLSDTIEEEQPSLRVKAQRERDHAR